ncbi:MAG: alanine dehydrogenase, partial [Gammaproteobacteria bacterium]|nr:alanine dehydrogenase [Gammaproteobacteria bacterium]
ASIVSTAKEIFERSEMIVKVKEPQPDECKMLSSGQVLFTYLHLAPDELQTRLLVESGVTAIAYETVTGPDNSLPLLAPMSEVAGRLAIQAGAHALEKAQGGNGTLLGGVTGVAPAKVLIIGGGVVGTNAAQIATGMGADVTLLDRSLSRLSQLDNELQGRVKCLYSTAQAIEKYALRADMVVGAVLLPGAKAPKLIDRDLISRMSAGSVLVDVAIDQGGCFETSKPTTHQEPTYIVDDVVHYCVANMPGAVPRTSTFALNNATLPFTLALADKGFKQAIRDDQNLLQGLNVHAGKVTYQAVAEVWDYDYVDALSAIA